MKYRIVPKGNLPYEVPTSGEETTYHVQKQGDQTIESIEVVVQLHTEWAPNDTVRIEGYMRTEAGLCGVIGLYRLHSIEADLGILEVQDA